MPIQLAPDGAPVPVRQVAPPSVETRRLPGLSAAASTSPFASEAIQCHCSGARVDGVHAVPGATLPPSVCVRTVWPAFWAMRHGAAPTPRTVTVLPVPSPAVWGRVSATGPGPAAVTS